VQDTSSSSESAPETTESVAAPAAPSPERSSGAGLNLSDDAQIATDIAAGIRTRSSARSRDDQTTRATSETDDEDADEDDDADEAEESADPSEPTPEPARAEREASAEAPLVPLKGRAKLRADLATERERATQLAAQVEDLNRQLGFTDARYAEIKPAEEKAILSDEEFHRLAYIEGRGGLSYDDQLTLETARTLRQFRQVWIHDSDQRVMRANETLKGAFLQACTAIKDRWGLKEEAINTAPTFEDLFELFARGGYTRAKSETREEVAKVKQDNSALSAREAGRSARPPERGGRSAPVTPELPGSDASPLELIRAGLAGDYGHRRNGARHPSRR